MTGFSRPAVQKQLETTAAWWFFDSGSPLMRDVPPQPLASSFHSISLSVFTCTYYRLELSVSSHNCQRFP